VCPFDPNKKDEETVMCSQVRYDKGLRRSGMNLPRADDAKDGLFPSMGRYGHGMC
jgi:hypothetical protein